MAKKKKTKIGDEINTSPIYSDNYNLGVTEGNMADICTEYMKVFGANINILRHTPFLIDGLKPSARKILYTMWAIVKARHTDKFRKAGGIATQAMNIHPHGDTSLYQVLVKLAQPWVNLVCPVEVCGNGGSITGAPAAAGRYLEARLSFFGYKCFFEDFDPDIINMVPTYNGDYLEPEVLPAKYPNVIINNSYGIGYGVVSAIPTFNFKEVCELTMELMKNPAKEDVYLIPDIPTGCQIVDRGEFPQICETGKGKFTMRGNVTIEDNLLHITSVPFRVPSDNIKADVLALADEGKLTGLMEIKDLSKDSKVDLTFLFKKEIDLKAVEHLLYKKTSLQKTEHISLSVVDDYKFVTMSLKEILLEWIDWRREFKRSAYNKKYVKAKERCHLLELLIRILSGDNLEKTTRITKTSKNRKDMIDRFIKEYDISSLQASYLADLKFSAFTIEARQGYEEELKKLEKAEIPYYQKIMLSKSEVDKTIIEELKEGIKLFGEERRSEVINIDGESVVSETDHLIVFTKEGYVKKLPSDAKNVGQIAQGDYPTEVVHINNTQDLIVFDSQGNLFKLSVSDIASTPLDHLGEKLKKYIQYAGEVRSVMPKPTNEAISTIKRKTGLDSYFIMVTKNGIIKKTLIDRYTGINGKLLAMVVKDGDELVSVKCVMGDKDIIVYSAKGQGVRFNTAEVRETSRTSIGVKAFDIEAGDWVKGCSLVNKNDCYIFMISNKGNGKKCTLETFATMNRASNSLNLIRLADDEYLEILESVIGNESFKVFLKGDTKEIALENVPELTRLAKGSKLIPVRKGDNIIDVREI